ncbi:PREDICTED: actin-related protein 10 [Nicrophorus vespilloides]|uniref:Actin-related protein 10 n=1 Tax=Nicrophorus vespilloides TaxID=110193 RepID=A0ABM1MDM9_NICVS|nr:PREDICTED: actin-related protein 10 [Nicrophorus vespilloides]
MPIYEGITTEKLHVVIDIGSAYTKLGFSGEHAPRCIIRTEVFCKKTHKVRKIYDYEDKYDLYDLLVDFIHILYFKYALISPKDKPVVIVESLLSPTQFRDVLAKVFFKHYEVSSIYLLPSHLVSLAGLGIETALVVDVGYKEATVIPICFGLPFVHSWQALPLASQSIHSNIKTLLASENMGMVDINENVLEDIKVRCCFVTTKTRAQSWNETKPTITPCPDVEYPYNGKSSLKISGKLRETVYELLYVEDNDHQCLSTMILDAILNVNLDLRKILAENILVIGGTAMAPGFKSRLKEELYKQLKCTAYEKLKVNDFKFHSSPSLDNYTAWLGGAIYSHTELIQFKSISREDYLRENRIPDWINLKDNQISLL